MTYIARCCCQACEIAAEGEPLLNAICNCDNCKRRTGSAFGWSAYFPDDKLAQPRGELSRYELPHMSAERFFCGRCGTTLFWRSTAFMPGHTGIAGGCFTETPLPDPAVSATDARRCAWITLPDGWLTAP
ncbi:MAG TPA: GFA family protein [Caulobacteraceae bacterium]|nr:GFA family protein [Caulobacteraceae bacterium]